MAPARAPAGGDASCQRLRCKRRSYSLGRQGRAITREGRRHCTAMSAPAGRGTPRHAPAAGRALRCLRTAASWSACASPSSPSPLAAGARSAARCAAFAARTRAILECKTVSGYGTCATSDAPLLSHSGSHAGGHVRLCVLGQHSTPTGGAESGRRRRRVLRLSSGLVPTPLPRTPRLPTQRQRRAQQAGGGSRLASGCLDSGGQSAAKRSTAFP